MLTTIVRTENKAFLKLTLIFKKKKKKCREIYLATFEIYVASFWIFGNFYQLWAFQ